MSKRPEPIKAWAVYDTESEIFRKAFIDVVIPTFSLAVYQTKGEAKAHKDFKGRVIIPVLITPLKQKSLTKKK